MDEQYSDEPESINKNSKQCSLFTKKTNETSEDFYYLANKKKEVVQYAKQSQSKQSLYTHKKATNALKKLGKAKSSRLNSNLRKI